MMKNGHLYNNVQLIRLLRQHQHKLWKLYLKKMNIPNHHRQSKIYFSYSFNRATCIVISSKTGATLQQLVNIPKQLNKIVESGIYKFILPFF